MIITHDMWRKYIKVLREIDEKAAADMVKYVNTVKSRGLQGEDAANALIEYGYVLATKYGEASAALACEMYDAMALLQGASVPPAMPAPTATKAEVAKAVNGTKNMADTVMGAAIGRLSKRAGVDTTMQNAIRDGAEWAWVPQGDTCAFCITLASRGWQPASKKALKDGHADHIHANCDCTYAIRFNDSTTVQGYEPETYLLQYKDAEGSTPEQKINAMRRDYYAKNKDRINAQKRDAYQKQKERESSSAEETYINT